MIVGRLPAVPFQIGDPFIFSEGDAKKTTCIFIRPANGRSNRRQSGAPGYEIVEQQDVACRNPGRRIPGICKYTSSFFGGINIER